MAVGDVVGWVMNAWIMPSIAPTRTSGTRSALAPMNCSTRARSVLDAYAYQSGRAGAVRIAGVEFMIAPSRVLAMPVLPMPKRALRTQSITVEAWVASVACRVNARFAAFDVVKSSRLMLAGSAV